MSQLLKVMLKGTKATFEDNLLEIYFDREVSDFEKQMLSRPDNIEKIKKSTANNTNTNIKDINIKYVFEKKEAKEDKFNKFCEQMEINMFA
jgi:uncharacterized protein YpuA (DUF1002 family)